MITPVTKDLLVHSMVKPTTKCDKNWLYSAKMKISSMNV
ncbi:transcriptional regulator [Escherichia albertii]|uniref:Transcriptional regulator n=1 Tax=Escherichia albertii TaxID=208962 RepID=A0A7Z7YJV7_ESCAL|nr:transcriptional regulator [Escherichia albertii]